MVVLLPKTRVVGPLYRRRQWFSDGSPIPEGEKAGPYVLRKNNYIFSTTRAAVTNRDQAPLSHDEDWGPGRFSSGDRNRSESSSTRIFTSMSVREATTRSMRGAMVRGWMEPRVPPGRGEKSRVQTLYGIHHVRSRLGAAVAKGTEVQYRNQAIKRA